MQKRPFSEGRSVVPGRRMEISGKDVARFWAKVALPNGQGCMLWLRAKDGSGYGKFSMQGRYVGAHRVSYLLAYGPIPEGLVIDHVKARGCTNRHCVAPLHLEAVTNAENSRRGDTGKKFGALQRAKTHCPAGHPYAGDNLIVRPDVGRGCRACARKAALAFRARRTAA